MRASSYDRYNTDPMILNPGWQSRRHGMLYSSEAGKHVTRLICMCMIARILTQQTGPGESGHDVDVPWWRDLAGRPCWFGRMVQANGARQRCRAACTPSCGHPLQFPYAGLLHMIDISPWGALPRRPVHFEPARDSGIADTMFSCRLTPYAGAPNRCPCAFAMIPVMAVRQAVFAGIPPITRPVFPPPNLSTCFQNM